MICPNPAVPKPLILPSEDEDSDDEMPLDMNQLKETFSKLRDAFYNQNSSPAKRARLEVDIPKSPISPTFSIPKKLQVIFVSSTAF